MSIIDQLKELPEGARITVQEPTRSTFPQYEGAWRGLFTINAGELVEFVGIFERLLELAKDATHTGDGIAGWSRTHQELEKAIEDADAFLKPLREESSSK